MVYYKKQLLKTTICECCITGPYKLFNFSVTGVGTQTYSLYTIPQYRPVYICAFLIFTPR